MDGIAGFASDNENMYGEDILFAREVPEYDARVFLPADKYINSYIKDINATFTTKHAAVITFSPVFYSTYQIIIATDFVRTFAIISVGKDIRCHRCR